MPSILSSGYIQGFARQTTIIVLSAIIASNLQMLNSVQAQGGAPDSTITLNMPFVAGETWIVGGPGSFYGEGAHTNANSDYYATDWNLPGASDADLGKPVIPVADGTVSVVVAPSPSCPTVGLGCYVQIDHSDGYRTRYGHLQSVSVSVNSEAHTWTLIGKVGSTGNSTGPHLHLSFRRNGTSYCYNGGATCPNGETPQPPQGHRPSPMMTTQGPTTLADGGTYTSVNGRVYTPSLRADAGWNTHSNVRSDATESRVLSGYFYLNSGSLYATSNCWLDPETSCWMLASWVWPGNRGSAYQDGGEATSTVAAKVDAQRAAAVTGLLADGQGDPAWGSAGTDVHLPYVYKHNAWGYVSDITILNSTSSSTSVTITYRDRSGGAVFSQGPISIPGYGSTTVQPPTSVGTAFYGWARVQSTLPVVALADALYNGSNVDFNYTALKGATTFYLPYLMNYYSQWNSCFVVRNLSSTTSNTIAATYYFDTPPYSWSENITVAANGVSTVCQAAQPGIPQGIPLSAKLTSGTSFVVAVNQSRGTPGPNMAYGGFSRPTTIVELPYMLRNANQGDGKIWAGGIRVQNAGTQTASAMVTFYGPSGNTVTTTSLSIPPGDARNLYLPNVSGLPDGFIGSAVITSGQPLVAVGNGSCTNCTGDTAFAYNGINR